MTIPKNMFAKLKSEAQVSKRNIFEESEAAVTCPHCGYDLSSIEFFEDSDVCPNCGEHIDIQEEDEVDNAQGDENEDKQVNEEGELDDNGESPEAISNSKKDEKVVTEEGELSDKGEDPEAVHNAEKDEKVVIEEEGEELPPAESNPEAAPIFDKDAEIKLAQQEENDAAAKYLERAKRASEAGDDLCAQLFTELANDETEHAKQLADSIATGAIITESAKEIKAKKIIEEVRQAKAKRLKEEAEISADENKIVCEGCGKELKEEDLNRIDGEYYCPDCQAPISLSDNGKQADSVEDPKVNEEGELNDDGKAPEVVVDPKVNDDGTDKPEVLAESVFRKLPKNYQRIIEEARKISSIKEEGEENDIETTEGTTVTLECPCGYSGEKETFNKVDGDLYCPQCGAKVAETEVNEEGEDDEVKLEDIPTEKLQEELSRRQNKSAKK